MTDLWNWFLEHYGLLIDLMPEAIITSLALAVAAGPAGVLLLLRREALAALTLPQVVVLGSAIGLRYLAFDEHAELSPTAKWIIDHTGWPTLPGAVMAVTAALLLTALARLRRREGESRAAIVLLPSLFVGAICAAVLVVAGSAAHLVEVENRFKGNDLFVDPHLAEVSTLGLLVCGVVAAVLWRRWLLLAQAPGVASVAGLRPGLWDGGFLALLAIIILVGTNALGVVLVMALLFLPAGAVLPWVRRVPTAMFASSVLAVVIYAGGFLIANHPDFNWPLSQTVGGVGLGVFLVSYVASTLRP